LGPSPVPTPDSFFKNFERFLSTQPKGAKFFPEIKMPAGFSQKMAKDMENGNFPWSPSQGILPPLHQFGKGTRANFLSIGTQSAIGNGRA
jgi:hypothetical protein